MWASQDACLKCTLCMTQCPVISVNPDFPGPKALGPEWHREHLRGVTEPMVHVDACTFCQLCEAACPVNVPVAHLIAEHKAAVAAPLRMRLRDELMARPHRISPVARWTGVPRLLRAAGGISSKTPLPRQKTSRTGPLGAPLVAFQGRVGLFVDCYSAGYDAGLVERASGLLKLWGYEVVLLPQGSHCCGAAAYAAGKPQLAKREAVNTWKAIAPFQGEVTAVITLNATCDGTLREEWPRYFGIDTEMRVVPFDEIADRAPEEFWSRLREAASDVILLAHTTCRGKVTRGDGHLAALAHRAGFCAVEPSDAPCCGAGGSYAFKVEHEDTAEQLVGRIAEQSLRVRPDGIVTDSGTCALHIEHATRVKTRHPAYWLYEQYQRYLKGVVK